MENWVVKNASRYDRIQKNGVFMLKELLNQTTGPEGMKEVFRTLPDVDKYHLEGNFSLSPTLPTLFKDEMKTGGPLADKLKYKYNGNTVEVTIPDFYPKMSADRGNIIGVYKFRNV